METTKQQPELQNEEEPEDQELSFLTMSNLSKMVLPPLGVSSYELASPKSRRRVISPLDTKYRCWETFMVVLVVYSAWVYPFEVAFLGSLARGGLFIADNVICFFFAIDMVIIFFLAYIDKRTQLLVTDKKQIAIRYLSTFFVMDLASTVPFELLVNLFTGRPTGGVAFGILGLLRLWRLRKVKHFFARLEKDIRYSYFFVRCVRLLAVTLLLVHCFGCAFYLLADKYTDEGRTWIGAVMPDFKKRSIWVRYVASIYWSMTTMTTVGYGDIHAVNTGEMIFTVFYMICNLGFTSYLIGNMTSLVVDGSRRTMRFRDGVSAASSFVNRNRLPGRLREQIISYMCLRFRADSLNQQELMAQLPEPIYKGVCQHLFLPTLKQVYLFNGVSLETLLFLVSKTRAEYIPPKEYVITQNETTDDVYVIVSGEVEIILRRGDKEEVVGSLGIGAVFGEVCSLCNRPQTHTFRTKTLSQLLRLKHASLLEAMHRNHADSVLIIKNFLQRHVNMGDFNGSEDATIPCNLLSVAAIGNNCFLEELVKAGMDPDVSDSYGRTPLHLAAANGFEECVLVLVRNACSVNMRDSEGNTPLWYAMKAKHHKIFNILYQCACLSNPAAGGDLLCLAAKRNDLPAMKELVKQGLSVDLKDHEGFTALERAMEENNEEIASFLVANGANGGRPGESFGSHSGRERDGWFAPRVTIYRGHPSLGRSFRRVGVMISLPRSFDELKSVMEKKLGIESEKTAIANNEGSLVDCIDVVRDGDRLYLVDAEDFDRLSDVSS